MPKICEICKKNTDIDYIYIYSIHKNKINNFDNILNENEKLKKQLQEKEEEINKLKNGNK